MGVRSWQEKVCASPAPPKDNQGACNQVLVKAPSNPERENRPSTCCQRDTVLIPINRVLDLLLFVGRGMFLVGVKTVARFTVTHSRMIPPVAPTTMFSRRALAFACFSRNPILTQEKLRPCSFGSTYSFSPNLRRT